VNQDPWNWYESTDRQGMGTTLPSTPLHNTSVQATVADAFFSTFGGNVPESLNGCDDGGTEVNAPCMNVDGQEWFQPLRNQDYSFFVPAPPAASPGQRMLWEAEDRCGQVPANPGNPPFDDVEEVGEADDTAQNIGRATCDIPDEVIETVENGQPGIRVTVKANSGGSGYPANHYLAYAKRYKVAWDITAAVNARPRAFNVDFTHLHVYHCAHVDRPGICRGNCEPLNRGLQERRQRAIRPVTAGHGDHAGVCAVYGGHCGQSFGDSPGDRSSTVAGRVSAT